MSSETEMRRVMLHAAERLDAVKDHKTKVGYNEWVRLPADVLLAMGYAEGILRLLATYLKYDEPPQANGQGPETKAPRVPAGTEGSIGAELDTPSRAHAKPERNAAIVAAIRAGERQKDVADRFGISPRRVQQIVQAAP